MENQTQGTPEWFAARCGKVTASRVADLVAKTKTGWGASRSNYAAQLVAERLTGEVDAAFQSDAMKWGVEHEEEARNAYAFLHDADVTETGFVIHPEIEMSGASPDGLVSGVGLVEIKCPNTSTHIATLLNGGVPGKYRTQIMWQLACTGREWCDFISYDPRLPEQMRLYVERVQRDDPQIRELESQVRDFLVEVDITVQALLTNYGRDAA